MHTVYLVKVGSAVVHAILNLLGRFGRRSYRMQGGVYAVISSSSSPVSKIYQCSL
ncbi:hypothetical protein DENSPDRAFT_354520 [Dentipellis sp. KUC8613]|nr:hypothetical protein DENSPDRAFT_354520 [Dentipellis sp. KUC8613]